VGGGRNPENSGSRTRLSRSFSLAAQSFSLLLSHTDGRYIGRYLDSDSFERREKGQCGVLRRGTVCTAYNLPYVTYHNFTNHFSQTRDSLRSLQPCGKGLMLSTLTRPTVSTRQTALARGTYCCILASKTRFFCLTVITWRASTLFSLRFANIHRTVN
jgi:hypothetical protein